MQKCVCLQLVWLELNLHIIQTKRFISLQVHIHQSSTTTTTINTNSTATESVSSQQWMETM